MFQLEQAVNDWKQALTQGEAVSNNASEKLETHLRDSIDQLKATSLSEEEAFIVALHRIGSPAVLDDEYGKVHQPHVWLGRTILMLCRYLLISLFLKFIAFDQTTAGVIGLAFGWETMGINSTLTGLPHHWSAMLSAVIGLIGVGIMIWALLSLARGPGQSFLKGSRTEDRFFASTDRAPRSVGKWIGWWIALYASLSIAQFTLNAMTTQHLSATGYGLYARALNIYNIGTHSITVIALLILTGFLCRQYQKLATVSS